MSRTTKIILAVTFVLVFAAGAVVGMVRQRVVIGTHPPGPRGSVLTKERNLTPDQQEQMRRIWSDLGPASGRDREYWDKRRELQRQRDDAILALLTDEQKVKYDAIQKEYGARAAELSKERQAAFQQAVDRTKAILTPEQAAKYETFLNKRHADGGPPWRDRRDNRDHPPSTTRP
jgi:Spy/CpxP family protein refolding chaperone